MPTIIKHARIIESEFSVMLEVTDITAARLLDIHHVIVPLTCYMQHQTYLLSRHDVGVWLDADEVIETIATFVKELPVIALNFTTFADGRAYSSANVLKRKLGYSGEIRAIGDVRRDQLSQMVHCGFNAFQMAEDQDLEAALNSLQAFSHNYHSTAQVPEPLFRQKTLANKGPV